VKPVEELLPIRAPALFIEEVVASDERRTVCRARVPASSPFARGGAVPAYVSLEIAAQAAGVHGGRHRDTSGEDYLVVVRDTLFRVDHFAADAALEVEVHLDGEAAALALFRFVVRDASSVIAEGQLGTYVTSLVAQGLGGRRDSVDGMDTDFEVVARAKDLFEARLWVGLLETNGVPARIPDENMVGALDGAVSIWTEGVRVEVPGSRADEAKRLLEENRRANED